MAMTDSDTGNNSAINIDIDGSGNLEAEKIAGRDIVELSSPASDAVKVLGDASKTSGELIKDLVQQLVDSQLRCEQRLRDQSDRYQDAIDRILREKAESEKLKNDAYQLIRDTQQIIDDKNKEIKQLKQENTQQAAQINQLEKRVNALEYKKK